MNPSRIILASSSVIRKTLLQNAGLNFLVQPSFVDESQLKALYAKASAKNLALFLAEHKALSLNEPDALIIGADQTLSLQTKAFDKARNIAELKQHLRDLRGQTHILTSAVAVVSNGKLKWSYVDQALMTMRNFSDEFLDTYIATSAKIALSCVGGYQLEAEGINLFEKTEGDYFTILGLPLLPLLAYLRQENYLKS